MTISSLTGSGFDTTFWHTDSSDGSDKTIELHIDKIAASDILELTIDWNKIHYDNCTYYLMDSNTVLMDRDTVITLYTQTLGDYSHNNSLLEVTKSF